MIKRLYLRFFFVNRLYLRLMQISATNLCAKKIAYGPKWNLSKRLFMGLFGLGFTKIL